VVTAVNATNYLTTPTPDTSGQMVHPDVYDAGEDNSWNGHRYWMAVTPYTDTVSAVEAVCILVSDDKLTWTVPNGLTNPISAACSDPNIFNVGGTMYVVYRYSGDSLYFRTSSDGITWSGETSLLSGAANSLLSPALVYYGDQWLMFTVKFDQATPANSIIERRTCATVGGTWSAPITCTISIPSGQYPWHVDVIVDGDRLYMALNMSAQYLYLAYSTDGGSTWTLETPTMINPKAAAWDANIYRSSIVRTSQGFDTWYSANNNGNPKVWHVGYVHVYYPLVHQ
jgi:hypothetical protein